MSIRRLKNEWDDTDAYPSRSTLSRQSSGRVFELASLGIPQGIVNG
jgi:hypothetical protein